MVPIYTELTKKMKLSVGINEKELNKLISSLSFSLPNDYIDFLKFSNGAEGEIGINYLSIWRVEDLLNRNEACSVESFAPGLFLFGSDGGGEAFGFDYRTPNPFIVNLPFVGMEWKIATKISDNFLDFLKKLSLQDWLDFL